MPPHPHTTPHRRALPSGGARIETAPRTTSPTHPHRNQRPTAASEAPIPASKPATAPDLLRIVASLAEGGLRQLKLFFIATGLEAEPDAAELEALLKGIRAQAPACRLIASFMPLFHAPFTPLQFAPLRAWSPELERSLMSAVRSAGGEFRWSAAPGEIILMNRLCRAGRAATPALVDFALRRGLDARQLRRRAGRKRALSARVQGAAGNGSPPRA